MPFKYASLGFFTSKSFINPYFEDPGTISKAPFSLLLSVRAIQAVTTLSVVSCQYGLSW